MYISSVKIKNFRSIIETQLIFDQSKKQDLTLIIGKNNTGKTSFIMLFDKFFRKEVGFDFNDFPISSRKQIVNISQESDLSTVTIGLHLTINYESTDNLEHLSEFITDLDTAINEVKLYFECAIDKEALLKDLENIEPTYKNKFIEKSLSNYLCQTIYLYIEESEIADSKDTLVKKDISEIKKIINYQVIHAKRNLASSESTVGNNLPLSRLSSDYFNKENKFTEEKFKDINNAILKMDNDLTEAYKTHFGEYFDTVNDFLGGASLNVLSNLESKQILSNFSKIVYGEDSDSYLPESQNGLGHLNILFLLLQIEVKKKFFEQEKKDINILFLEEPEAHTHPQMQYVFAKKIKSIIRNIPNLQTIITTHSSHIVSQCDFEDIRYFKSTSSGIQIKHFYRELKEKYASEPEYFKFLKQYVTLNSSELFFAEKVVFIEGLSERILLPLFIKEYDDANKTNPDYVPLASQNISYIEAGANAKVFRHLIEFLEIKTLIITDIDTTSINENSRWSACSVSQAENSSNETLKYYLKFDKASTFDKKNWIEKIKRKEINPDSSYIEVAYQTFEGEYHARSFEDAFVSCNAALLYKHKDNEDLLGVDNIEQLEHRKDYFQLTSEVLTSKSEFASSMLFLALTKDINWKTPEYISNAIKWIAE